METEQILNLHKQLLEIYRTAILPIITKYFDNKINSTQEKSGGEHSSTLVSEADLSINNILKEKLPELIPGASIISEESENSIVNKYAFVIDPIDGTHSFVRSLDDWGINIELCEDGKTIYSIIFFPNCKTEYYYAIKGLGAFDSSDEKIVSKKSFIFKPLFISCPSSRKIGRALINYTEGKMLSFRVYGSVVYAFYTVLRGGTDLIVFDDLNIWDILGCVFIAEQMGLIVYWFSEKPKLDNTINLKETYYTLMIYKPDLNNKLLKDLQNIINGVIS